jgi:hypothetical protein
VTLYEFLELFVAYLPVDFFYSLARQVAKRRNVLDEYLASDLM